MQSKQTNKQYNLQIGKYRGVKVISGGQFGPQVFVPLNQKFHLSGVLSVVKWDSCPWDRVPLIQNSIAYPVAYPECTVVLLLLILEVRTLAKHFGFALQHAAQQQKQTML